MDSFNRYMVECEFFSRGRLSRRRKGFNRYMVECESHAVGIYIKR